jgi:hypothetical protein
MVALDLQSQTAVALDAARAAADAPRDGYRIPASRLGDPCDRALWYSFRWVSPPKRFDGRMLRLFEDGNLGETQLLNELRAVPGVAVVDRDQRDPSRQLGVSFADGHGWGFLDAEAAGLPEAPATIHVVEIKTHKADNWRAVKKHGVKAKKPEHYAQMMIYMHGRSRTRALYLYKNKDTSEVESERIDYVLSEAVALNLRAERIAYADRPPARLHDDPDAKAAFQCRFCEHRGHCHEQAPSRRTCRSCLHATPVRGGSWVCDRFELELTREAQGQGCPHHLLIPDLVHGVQVDADLAAGWIEYRMPDGSTWRDRSGGIAPEGAQ